MGNLFENYKTHSTFKHYIFFPHEDEMNALAFNVFLMLKGDIP